MPIGVSLQLFNGSTPQANLTGIQALWFDVTQPKDASRPAGKSSLVTTDTNGYVNLDLSNVTGLSVGAYGFLVLYKLDGSNHQDSQIFAGKVQTSAITSGVDMYYYDSGWTRPADWLTLPNVGVTEQKFVGLHAVWPDSNFLALSAAGAYTVDWGDGSAAENIATGVTAYHQYDYADADLDGTECTRGYKQALVTITPQSGQNLTSINLSLKHNQTGLLFYVTGWLDILVSGPNLTSLSISASSQNVFFHILEQFQLISANSITSFANMFYSCTSLQSIPRLNTAAGTNFSYMFYSCTSLQSIPLLNTAAGTNFLQMFFSCSSLKSIPPLNTAAGTSFYQMFQWCVSLRSVPLINTAAGTGSAFYRMFSSCISLQSIPLLNIAGGTSFGYMFGSCYSLQSIPLLVPTAGTDFNSMFNGCYSLIIPFLNQE